MAAAHIFIVI